MSKKNKSAEKTPQAAPKIDSAFTESSDEEMPELEAADMGDQEEIGALTREVAAAAIAKDPAEGPPDMEETAEAPAAAPAGKATRQRKNAAPMAKDAGQRKKTSRK